MLGKKQQKQQKQRQHHVLPADFVRVACAYVVRLAPLEHEGVKLRQDLGRFDNLYSYSDLLRQVERLAGGGRYRARYFDAENKRIYIATDTFTIPGTPPQTGGQSAAPGEELKAEARQKAERLLEQVQHERAKLEVEREQRLVDIETIQRQKREFLLLQKIKATGSRGPFAARSGGVNVHGKRPGPGSGTLGRGIARPR
jgi:hypothetical protein